MSLYGGIKFSIGDHKELAKNTAEDSQPKQLKVLGEGASRSTLSQQIIALTTQMMTTKRLLRLWQVGHWGTGLTISPQRERSSLVRERSPIIAQILMTDHTPTAPPSLLPAKKYCDITGLPAAYTDPRTKLRYKGLEVWHVVRGLVNTFLQTGCLN